MTVSTTIASLSCVTSPAETPETPETPDLRAALVHAARAELEASGRAGVSLRAVARRAGVSHAAPAYAFGDRAGMLSAVAAAGFRELAEVMDVEVDEAARSATGGVLAELGGRYVRFAAERPALYELMFRPADLRADDPALQAARRDSLRALVAATGTAADGAPGEVAVLSWALAHGVASLVGSNALEGLAHDPTRLLDRFARLVEGEGSG